MTDQEYMYLAIAEAKKAAQHGTTPLGVIIVKDDQVITVGTGHVGEHLDPTAHGESFAMKQACQKLHTLDLSGCTLYTTIEPCSMCLGCAGWTGLSRIVFGAFREDAPGNPYEIEEYHAIEHAKKFHGLSIVGGVLRDDCAALMTHVQNWTLQHS